MYAALDNHGTYKKGTSIVKRRGLYQSFQLKHSVLSCWNQLWQRDRPCISIQKHIRQD